MDSLSLLNNDASENKHREVEEMEGFLKNDAYEGMLPGQAILRIRKEKTKEGLVKISRLEEGSEISTKNTARNSKGAREKLCFDSKEIAQFSSENLQLMKETKQQSTRKTERDTENSFSTNVVKETVVTKPQLKIKIYKEGSHHKVTLVSGYEEPVKHPIQEGERSSIHLTKTRKIEADKDCPKQSNRAQRRQKTKIIQQQQIKNPAKDHNMRCQNTSEKFKELNTEASTKERHGKKKRTTSKAIFKLNKCHGRTLSKEVLDPSATEKLPSRKPLCELPKKPTTLTSLHFPTSGQDTLKKLGQDCPTSKSEALKFVIPQLEENRAKTVVKKCEGEMVMLDSSQFKQETLKTKSFQFEQEALNLDGPVRKQGMRIHSPDYQQETAEIVSLINEKQPGQEELNEISFQGQQNPLIDESSQLENETMKNGSSQSDQETLKNDFCQSEQEFLKYVSCQFEQESWNNKDFQFEQETLNKSVNLDRKQDLDDNYQLSVLLEYLKVDLQPFQGQEKTSGLDKRHHFGHNLSCYLPTQEEPLDLSLKKVSCSATAEKELLDKAMKEEQDAEEPNNY